VSPWEWDQAGLDTELARARAGIAADRFGDAALLLEQTRVSGDWERRAHAVQVLAASAQASDIARRWMNEQPDNPDAVLLAARVSLLWAAQARREHQTPRLRQLLASADALWRLAAQKDPGDPVPYAVPLHLEHLSPGAFVLPREAGVPMPYPVPGPWHAWRIADDRLHASAEAAHTLLAFYLARRGGQVAHVNHVADFLAHRAPLDSPLRLLPAYAAVEALAAPDAKPPVPLDDARAEYLCRLYRLLGDKYAEWVTARPDARYEAEHRIDGILEMVAEALDPQQRPAARMVAARAAARDVYETWFPRQDAAPPVYATARDLSVLAWALGPEDPRTRRVLEHLGPVASPYPWRLLDKDGDPERALRAFYLQAVVDLPRRA